MDKKPVFSPEVFVDPKMDSFFGLKLKKNFAQKSRKQVNNNNIIIVVYNVQ